MNTLRAKQQLEEIVRRYADMIYRIAYQNTKSKADADDIFQEVCLTLLTKDAPLDDEAHLKHFLIRVTLNKCKNLHRSAWYSRTEPLDDNILCDSGERRLLDELRRLPPNYRNALYLHYYEGYTTAEIAEMMGAKQNTVLSWLARGRKRLKHFLTE